MKLSSAGLASLFMVVFVIGLGTGFYISPAYQSTMFDKAGMDLGPADFFVDLRYLNSMAAHHQAAIDLAVQVSGVSQRPEINNLAKEIIASEPKLITQLQQWKKSWYGDFRSVPPGRVVKLGSYDASLDLRFLNALIYHHQQGIEMARDIRTKSSRTEVLSDAQAVETFLATSLVSLKDWRQQWYGIK